MKLRLLRYRPAKLSGPRCVVCHDAVNSHPQVRIRGMHFHQRCATYKLRTERSRRR